MSDRALKAMAGKKAAKFGHFIVEFATPGIGHIMKSAGCEFVLFDLEHSGFGFETVKSAVRYFEAAGVSMIVRAPSKEYHHIARACDMGAEGIMLPMVGSAKEARHILDCMKYDPAGKRGVALGVAHDRYRPGAVSEKFKAANAKTTLFCQIETAEGVKNADAMAAMDGVDCLWVGHFDLSVSLGIPGQFEHPTFLKAIDTVANATARHGKSLGRLVPNVETGIEYNTRWGFDFICYSGDVWVLHNALQEAVTKLRSACKGKSDGKKDKKGKKK
jgi:2-keto-3-deoxy-L-rhamnonate aldolase RhmA